MADPGLGDTFVSVMGAMVGLTRSASAGAAAGEMVSPPEMATVGLTLLAIDPPAVGSRVSDPCITVGSTLLTIASLADGDTVIDPLTTVGSAFEAIAFMAAGETVTPPPAVYSM